MVPLPAVVFNQIAFPLQLLRVPSRRGGALDSPEFPVLREGNILVLSTMKLEVAQACSGIRSLVSLVTLAMILGKLSEPRRWARVVLALRRFQSQSSRTRHGLRVPVWRPTG